MQGWIKLHRKMKEWEWYKDSQTFHLFCHLMLSANRKDQTWKGMVIKRGQLVTGRKSLSEDTGISQQTIRTIIKRLISTNEITIKPTNKYSIVTLCNFDSYQDLFCETNQQINQESNQQLTSNQPTINQQLTTNKKEKKDKKEEKEKNIKHKYGEFKNVLLTDEENQKLLEKFGEHRDYWINVMDEAIEMKGYKYKSHYLAILKWSKNESNQPNNTGQRTGQEYQFDPERVHSRASEIDNLFGNI